MAYLNHHGHFWAYNNKVSLETWGSNLEVKETSLSLLYHSHHPLGSIETKISSNLVPQPFPVPAKWSRQLVCVPVSLVFRMCPKQSVRTLLLVFRPGAFGEGTIRQIYVNIEKERPESTKEIKSLSPTGFQQNDLECSWEINSHKGSKHDLMMTDYNNFCHI